MTDAHPTAEQVRSSVEQDLEGPIVVDDSWTFVYAGSAESVEVVFMEDRFPPGGPMQQIEGTDIWHFQVSAPPDSMIEYKFAVTRDGTRRLVADPSNPVEARDPFGANSLATGPAYVPPAWLTWESDDCHAVEVDVESAVWGRSRRHQLLYPPGYEPGSSRPLLILHDGQDYVDYAGLGKCITYLHSNHLIRAPLIFLHQPGQRHTAYADNGRHISHVLDEVVPRIRVDHQIEGVFAGGASLGGVASLSLAHRRRGEIDGLMLQSGSLIRELGGRYQRGKVLAPAVRLRDEVVSDPSGLPDRIAISCGTFDGLVEENRDLVPRLEGHIAELSYREINAGHHWLCWRDLLQPDLVALFGSN